MDIHILHSGLLGPTTDPYNDYRNQFDAGKYAFSVISASRWGRDEYLMQGGHDQHSPDVIIAHSSVFQFDLLRMLRFILSTRARAPWIVYVLLLNTDEEKEVASFPTPIRDHFSRYFQVARAQFSMIDINEYVATNFQKIEELVLAKRRQYFDTEIVSRGTMDNQIRHESDTKYDFALSFSGAQRTQARDLANALKGRGCDIFFDEFETLTIVGKNLVEELYKIYNSESRYCVLLVSEEYKAGPWTNQERRAALDKAIKDTEGTYIIPIKIHDVDLPGLSSSIAYLKWQSNPTELANVLYGKLVTDMVG
jgi:TIR domain